MTRHEPFPFAALVALDRELSKQFFAARLDAERLSFVYQLARSGRAPAVLLDTSWTTLHRLLNRQDSAATGSRDTAALSMALAGGRPMHENADSVVMLLRPDLVPIVADALHAFNMEGLVDARRAELVENGQTEDIPTIEELPQLISLAERLEQFYRQAKQSSAAVTFAAWSSNPPA